MELTQEQKDRGLAIAHKLNRWADIRDQINEKPDRQGKRLNSRSLRDAVQWIHEIINPEENNK